MTRTDMLRCCRIYADLTAEVSLFKVIFSNALNLLKDVTDSEACRSLQECTLTDIVNLLEIKNAVEDAFGLVQGLVGDFTAFLVKVAVQLLKIHERHFGRLLDLANNLFGEVVEVFLGVHQFLKVNH